MLVHLIGRMCMDIVSTDLCRSLLTIVHVHDIITVHMMKAIQSKL